MAVARRALFLVAISLAGLAACAKFGSDDDRHGSDDDGGSASTDDASGPGHDGAPDGGADGVSPVVTCGSVHAFCDDFDQAPVGSSPEWNIAPTVTMGGSISVRKFAGALSAPNVVEGRATAPGQAILRNQIPVTRGATCSFTFQVTANEPNASSPSVAMMTLSSSTGANYNVDFRLDTLLTSGRLADGGGPLGKIQVIDTKPDGVWKKVVIALVFGTGGYVHVDLDGKRVLAVDGSPLVDIKGAGNAELDLGLMPLASAGSWTVLYDDVVCDPIK